MLGTVLFLILALVAVLAAVGMLTSNNAIHAALFLVINFVCIALFYLGLGAPFLAMVQITVYAGAIMVLFLFVIMLLGAERVPLESRLRWQTPLAVLLVLLLVGVSVFVLFSPQAGINLAQVGPVDPASGMAETFGSPQAVAQVLFSRYVLPFELTGVLLLIAMIGVMVLTRDKKKVKPEQDVLESASTD
jgi:NADH-quinone oxidoreductase subunit J